MYGKPKEITFLSDCDNNNRHVCFHDLLHQATFPATWCKQKKLARENTRQVSRNIDGGSVTLGCIQENLFQQKRDLELLFVTRTPLLLKLLLKLMVD